MWAFSVSPHGLAIPEDKFWTLTPREWFAFKKVHDAVIQRWAIERSMEANVNFVKEGDEPWTPEDFMGTGNRTARSIQNAHEKMSVMQANTYLNRITKNTVVVDEDLPAWASN